MSLDTRGFDQKRLLPQSLEERLLGMLSRSGGIVLLTICVLLWASLVSWSIRDPSLTHATAAEPRNVLGPLGAIVSDLLLQMLGFAAVIALLAPMFWGVALLREKRLDSGRVKVGFYPLSILICAAALSSLPVVEAWPLRHGFGGVLGDGLYKLAGKLAGLVNTDRAGLAAGVMLTFAAAATTARSFGTDIDKAFKSLMAARPRVTIAGLCAIWTSLCSRIRTRRTGQPLAIAALDDPAEPAFARYQSPEREVEASVEREPVMRRSNPIEAAPTLDDPFDQMTDDESRAIAVRFAPAAVAGTPVRNEREVLKQRPPVGLAGAIMRKSVDTGWSRPSLNLLRSPVKPKPGTQPSDALISANAKALEDVLTDFSIKGDVKDVRPGPVVTLYEFEPARGTKSSRVIGLANDIARSLSLVSVRAAVVQGRNAIGLELPNLKREPVLLREILDHPAYQAADCHLPLALGKSISGEAVVTDLAQMPHLLVAGTTGSGKSVGVNAMILSLLYRHGPDQCRLLMIDPKMLELSVYNGIPHLLTPVVTDPHKAVVALNWAVSEMGERYKRMATLSVRNIDVFNNRVRNAKKRGEMLSRTVQTGFDAAGRATFEQQHLQLETMARIVIVVDEFADLMSVAGKEVEFAVQRLAQMARAAGIHLIMATQRPSVDVITGTIKANFPSRISYKVTSKIDSRTILNEQGAEQLLGQGDMLYSTGAGQIMRVHGAFVSDEEVEAIAGALRRQGPPHYVDGILDGPDLDDDATPAIDSGDAGYYQRAVAIVLKDGRASTSYLQRRLSIGYNKAASLIERMEGEGLVSAANAAGKRDIKLPGASVNAA